MDRSRSPRNLSDEARLLQRLEEVELPPGATDAERAAARAEAEAAVGQAANNVGWARAYRELHPDRQPAPTFNVMAMFDSWPAHIQAEVRPLSEQYHRQGQTMWRDLEMAIVETLERFPEYVNQQLAQQAQQNPERLAEVMRESLPTGVDADQLVQDMATRSSPVVQVPIDTRVEFTLLGITQQGTVTSLPNEHGLQEVTVDGGETVPFRLQFLTPLTRTRQPQPFTGQGNRLGE